MGVSGNGYTLSNISYSTFTSNTAAQTDLASTQSDAANGGIFPCALCLVTVSLIQACQVLAPDCSVFWVGGFQLKTVWHAMVLVSDKQFGYTNICHRCCTFCYVVLMACAVCTWS